MKDGVATPEDTHSQQLLCTGYRDKQTDVATLQQSVGRFQELEMMS